VVVTHLQTSDQRCLRNDNDLRRNDKINNNNNRNNNNHHNSLNDNDHLQLMLTMCALCEKKKKKKTQKNLFSCHPNRQHMLRFKHKHMMQINLLLIGTILSEANQQKLLC
jgi:hypothetical protein